MEKVLLFFPFYTQSYNRLRVFKTFFLSLLLIPKNYSIYISGIICTLKFCTLETSRDILSHLWSLNMRKSCYKTCFPRSCKIVKERNPFNFFYHIYAITRLSTSQQQAKARQKFTKILLFKLKWYFIWSFVDQRIVFCFQFENNKVNWQNVFILNKTKQIIFVQLRFNSTWK